MVIKPGEIKEERYYLGNYEVYRKFVGITLETERTTVAVVDDKRKIATLDKLTVEERSLINMPVAVIRYQYDNHLGSASLELDATAQIISYEEYHPFGSTSYWSGQSESEVKKKRYRYVGKERDEETGLYYYGARYYAAWIGRFVSVDPLAEKYLNLSPYVYVADNPIKYIDPDGKGIILVHQKCTGDCYQSSEGSHDTKWSDPQKDFISKEAISAMQNFLDTKEGYEFFSLFANANDKITVGDKEYVFKEKGKFSHHNIIMTDKVGYSNPGANAVHRTYYNHTWGNYRTTQYKLYPKCKISTEDFKEGMIMNKPVKFQTTIEIDLYFSSFPEYGNYHTLTIGHEFFIHSMQQIIPGLESLSKGDYLKAIEWFKKDSGDYGNKDHVDYMNNPSNYKDFYNYIKSLKSVIGVNETNKVKKFHDDKFKNLQ